MTADTASSGPHLFPLLLADDTCPPLRDTTRSSSTRTKRDIVQRLLRGLPFVEDGVGGVVAGSAGDLAAGVGAGAAQVEAGDGGAVAG